MAAEEAIEVARLRLADPPHHFLAVQVDDGRELDGSLECVGDGTQRFGALGQALHFSLGQGTLREYLPYDVLEPPAHVAPVVALHVHAGEA